MDLSNFVTYKKQESLLLSFAKSYLNIVENTLSKHQETLEFKMTKQKESFHSMFPWIFGTMDVGSNKFSSLQHCI